MKNLRKVTSLLPGRFLRQQRKLAGRTIKDIAKKATQIKIPQGFGGSIAYFSRMERGEIDIKPEYIEVLSQLYDVDALLLISIMPRQTEGVVKLGNGKRLKNCEIFTDSASRGTVYYIPNRRLSVGNMAIVFLHLESQGVSKKHGHYPNHNEILICESGEVVLHFPDDDWHYTLESGDVIHFGAGHSHYIENIGTEVAKLIAIKEYGISP